MERIKGYGLAVLILISAANLSGCALLVAAGAGAAAGVGAAEYVGGELKQEYAAPLDKTWEAALAAVQELKMKSSEKFLDNLDQNRVIKGQTEEGKAFQISLSAVSKDITMVKVRIGTFGDEEFSKKVQGAIAGSLKRV
ncbi:MAG TPA: DUF3568 family protein [Thermodesulfobacteriota bacterium]|nr:DUF3568 family protein [Thermodesulfobacteriota bacterium]